MREIIDLYSHLQKSKQAEQKIADTMERNNSKHVLRQSAKAAKARKNYEKAKELNDALLMNGQCC